METDVIKEVLIAGIGNIARMDDGIGVHVINYMLEEYSAMPECVEILEVGSAIHDLLPAMIGRQKVIIVDAIRARSIPGSVYSIPSTELKSGAWKVLEKSSELRNILLQCYIASGDIDIDLVGIEPELIDMYSMQLSDSIHKRIPAASEEIFKLVSKFTPKDMEPEYE